MRQSCKMFGLLQKMPGGANICMGFGYTDVHICVHRIHTHASSYSLAVQQPGSNCSRELEARGKRAASACVETERTFKPGLHGHVVLTWRYTRHLLQCRRKPDLGKNACSTRSLECFKLSCISH